MDLTATAAADGVGARAVAVVTATATRTQGSTGRGASTRAPEVESDERGDGWPWARAKAAGEAVRQLVAAQEADTELAAVRRALQLTSLRGASASGPPSARDSGSAGKPADAHAEAATGPAEREREQVPLAFRPMLKDLWLWNGALVKVPSWKARRPRDKAQRAGLEAAAVEQLAQLLSERAAGAEARTQGGNRLGVVVVLPRALRPGALVEAHESVLSGHLGARRTYALLARSFWWPGMLLDVQNFVASCVACVARRSATSKPAGQMEPIVVSEPFECVAMDVLGPLSTTRRGNRYVIVFADYLTKWVEAVPLRAADAFETARAFFENVVCRHGAPRRLLSDQGANFMSRFLRSVTDVFRTQRVRTSPYHPQTDGMVERFNRTLAEMLAKFVAKEPETWDECLPAVLFAYRRSVHASTNETPFFLMFGRDPATAFWPAEAVRCLTRGFAGPQTARQWRTEVMSTLQDAWNDARRELETARERQRVAYDARHAQDEYECGDLVMVTCPAPELVGASAKLQWAARGPFRVVERVGKQTYRLCKVAQDVMRQAGEELGRGRVVDGHEEEPSKPIHVSRLRRLEVRPAMWCDPSLLALALEDGEREHGHGAPADSADVDTSADAEARRAGGGEHELWSGPAQAAGAARDPEEQMPADAENREPYDDDNVFEVEKIIEARSRGKGRRRRWQYLVKWAGYPDEDNSWVSAADILDKSLIDDFKKTAAGAS